MSEEIKPTPEPPEPLQLDSKLLGVSVRAWIAIVLTLTVCAMSGWQIEVKEPLYSAFLLTLGFYFGQKYSSKTP